MPKLQYLTIIKRYNVVNNVFSWSCTSVEFHFGQAEVSELDVALVAHQHVVRFQIPEERSRVCLLRSAARTHTGEHTLL